MSAFDRFHPAVPFAFLASVILFAVILRNPAFAAAGLGLAAASYLALSGVGGWKVVALAAAMVPVVALFNGLFSPLGATVAFEYLGGRPFTVESVAFGAVMGAAFATALLWFGCWNRVMTADRLTFLFGGAAPALTLTVTMVLRLVPRYGRKAGAIAEARRGVGEGVTGRGLRLDAAASAGVLSALTTWALEGALVTADSMASRGYGCAKRTSYERYRWRGRDIAALAVVLGLDGAVAASMMAGADATTYFPVIALPQAGPLFWAALACYGVLCALPALVIGYEEVQWRRSLSRI